MWKKNAIFTLPVSRLDFTDEKSNPIQSNPITENLYPPFLTAPEEMIQIKPYPNFSWSSKQQDVSNWSETNNKYV